MTIDGQANVLEALRRVPLKAPEIVKKAASTAMKQLEGPMRAAIPFESIKRGIGSSVRSRSNVLTVAKAGLGVNKLRADVAAYGAYKKKVFGSRLIVPHAHLYILGTDERSTGYTTRSYKRKDGSHQPAHERTGFRYRYTGKARPHLVLTSVIQAQRSQVAGTFESTVISLVQKEFNVI